MSARLALAAAVAVHLVVLYAPGAPSPPSGLRLDLLVHAAAFAAVAWAGRLAGIPVRPLLLALVLHAAVSELVQAQLLPGRAGDPLDVAADLAGVAVGALLPVRRRASPRVPAGER